jgi:hypothetical protein
VSARGVGSHNQSLHQRGAVTTIEVAPLASTHTCVGVRAMRMTTMSHPGQRITVPIPCA